MAIKNMYTVKNDKENERLLNLYCAAYMIFVDSIENHVYRHCETNGIEDMTNEELETAIVDFLYHANALNYINEIRRECEELLPFVRKTIRRARA